MFIWEAIQVIGLTIWGMFKALISLWPVFDQISSIPDQIVAAALGIPAAVISIGGVLFTIGKFAWRYIKDA